MTLQKKKNKSLVAKSLNFVAKTTSNRNNDKDVENPSLNP